MTFEKKETDPCVISLAVSIDPAEVQPTYKKVFGLVMRNAELPGFRKGKVPAAVLKQKFADEIRSECAEACVREFYPKALKESQLRVVTLQGVEIESFSLETGMKFTAKVEVRPEFDLPKYKKLVITPGDATVSEDQVTERLEGFRRAFAKFEDAKEGEAVSDGDFVQFDYTGYLDDAERRPLSEVAPEQKAVCGATDFWVQVEEGRFLPEILEALKGMKVGETKDDVKVKFPEEHAPEELKGRECVYSITLKTFRRRILPDDAAFAAAAKVESLDALRAQFREQMEKDAAAAELEHRKSQAIEQLLKGAAFDVPPSLIQRQTQSYLEELAHRAQYQGISGDYIDQNRDRIIADAKTRAEQQVRLSYILLGIAEAEKIEITDQDVEAGIAKMAAESNGRVTVEQLRARLDEGDEEGVYREQLRAERALDLVLAEAK